MTVIFLKPSKTGNFVQNTPYEAAGVKEKKRQCSLKRSKCERVYSTVIEE